MIARIHNLATFYLLLPTYYSLLTAHFNCIRLLFTALQVMVWTSIRLMSGQQCALIDRKQVASSR